MLAVLLLRSVLVSLGFPRARSKTAKILDVSSSKENSDWNNINDLFIHIGDNLNIKTLKSDHKYWSFPKKVVRLKGENSVNDTACT